ncbi:MAG: polysaccharide deacetylase family protein [bacterium]
MKKFFAGVVFGFFGALVLVLMLFLQGVGRTLDSLLAPCARVADAREYVPRVPVEVPVKVEVPDAHVAVVAKPAEPKPNPETQIVLEIATPEPKAREVEKLDASEVVAKKIIVLLRNGTGKKGEAGKIQEILKQDPATSDIEVKIELSERAGETKFAVRTGDEEIGKWMQREIEKKGYTIKPADVSALDENSEFSVVATLGAGIPDDAGAALLPILERAKATVQAPEIKLIHLTFDADMSRGMVKKLAEGAPDGGEVEQFCDPEIFTYLKERNAGATVFATGLFVETYQDVVKKWVADGFEIQNHSYGHVGFTPDCEVRPRIVDEKAQLAEIKKAQEAIKAVTGKYPTQFRFPGLCQSDAVVATVTTTLGLTVVGADVMTGDAFSRHPDRIAEWTIQNLRKTHGSTMLFHVGGRNSPSTLEALKIMIPKLQDKGYVFVP